MATANDIIKGALKLLGAISSGENPSAEETADGLDTLNELLESWSNENLMVFADTEDLFTLVPGQQAYTWGTAGDFTTARPLKIYEASLKVVSATPNYELPMEILNLKQWREITQKSTESTIPTACYLDTGYPLATISFYPEPSAAEKVIINSQKLITSFASSSETVSLPPGYIRALKYNLAVDIAPEYGQEPSNTVFGVAVSSKADIKRINIKPDYLKSDAAALVNGKPFNWLTGE